VKAGAVRRTPSIRELAASFNLPPSALAATLEETRALAAGRGSDPFGRNFTDKPPLAAPFYGARVTGALFHTQGGLEVDVSARVLRRDRSPFSNLFAAGGAARGVSGPTVDGYLSGNGLLTAVTLGRIAGTTAADGAE
jgi:fumarate reductase flavoprotein subunit